MSLQALKVSISEIRRQLRSTDIVRSCNWMVKRGKKPRGPTRPEISYAIATEIWLEIRNQGFQNPVEIRKSARNRKKAARITRKSREEIGKSSRNHAPFCLSMRSRPFAHAHLAREITREIRVGKSQVRLEIRKSRTPRSPCQTPRKKQRARGGRRISREWHFTTSEILHHA